MSIGVPISFTKIRPYIALKTSNPSPKKSKMALKQLKISTKISKPPKSILKSDLVKSATIKKQLSFNL